MLSNTYPDIALEWHPSKNGEYSPDEISEFSNEKKWWLCKKGHEWQAIVANRTRLGSGCPYCAGFKVTKERSLIMIKPELSKSWHPSRNGTLTPYDVTYASNKKVWWICEEGHGWEATVNNRSKGRGCPYCAGKKVTLKRSLAEVNPSLSKDWSEKNYPLSPEKVLPNSNKKVWWICRERHEWQAAIFSRNLGSGCPVCSGNKVSTDKLLTARYPEISVEWHPTKNNGLSLMNISSASSKKVWWQCDKGHEWQATVRTRSKGANCPYCYLEERHQGDV
ncbi:zinc-ribbon domain-containing protein [Priestia aryabhattai]|uniref:zinc-ribbon domain-containing protein n=1 Tax=Priestia aryabhattai TaxID=412384 RepID=UPI002040EA19|nr:zinc-ribbon domain-containing protein [Priestia aryabhattai]MCM3252446.1 zinc-ribbon domain-containing protein [Priestia aryabhattai]